MAQTRDDKCRVTALLQSERSRETELMGCARRYGAGLMREISSLNYRGQEVPVRSHLTAGDPGCCSVAQPTPQPSDAEGHGVTLKLRPGAWGPREGLTLVPESKS